MDVKTGEESSRSSKSLALSLLGAGALISAGVLASPAVSGDGDLLTTVLSVLLAGVVGPAAVGALSAVTSLAAAAEAATGPSPRASPSAMLPHAGAPVTTSRTEHG